MTQDARIFARDDRQRTRELTAVAVEYGRAYEREKIEQLREEITDSGLAHEHILRALKLAEIRLGVAGETFARARVKKLRRRLRREEE